MKLRCLIFGHKFGPWYQDTAVKEGDVVIGYKRSCSCGHSEYKTMPMPQEGCYWVEGCGWNEFTGCKDSRLAGEVSEVKVFDKPVWTADFTPPATPREKDICEGS